MNDDQGPDPSDDVPAPPPEAAWWQPAPALPPVELAAEPELPPERRRRWRKPLLVSLVVLLVLGGSGAGAKEYVDYRAEQREKQRIAAEKRAADAYVKAMRPLADRVYDTVQPILDAFEAFEKLRPGIYKARDDVILHSGTPAELTAVRKALVATEAPATHASAGVAMEEALGSLLAGVKELQTFARTSGKSTEGCAGCAAVEHFDAAVTKWQSAVAMLSVTAPLNSPGPSGGVLMGKARTTVGAFIHRSDLVCADSAKKLGRIPDSTPRQYLESLPKWAKVIRSSMASLKAVPLPPAQRSLDRRLDIQLQGMTSYASTLDKMYAAYKKRSQTRFAAAIELWEEQLRTLDALSKTYKTRGVSLCADFFKVDEKELKKAYST